MDLKTSTAASKYPFSFNDVNSCSRLPYNILLNHHDLEARAAGHLAMFLRFTNIFDSEVTSRKLEYFAFKKPNSKYALHENF